MNHPPQHSAAPQRKHPVLAAPVARWVCVLVGLAMFYAAGVPGHGAEPRFKDFEVKAGYLNNFNKFIEWQTKSLAQTNTPFVIAVAGPSLSTAELEKCARERKANTRELIVRTVTTPAEVKGAHILFVPAAEDDQLKEWLAAAHRSGALTVGESESFFKQGGIINFGPEGEKIRFDINIGQAEAAGLKISAQLQKVARTLRKKP